MKKQILLLALMLFAVSGLYAQGYIFVNSEKIFKSQADYNEAIKQLEELTTAYQKNIDDAYATIEQTYNNYQAQKAYLSDTRRAEREEAIIAMERKVTDYQKEKFGPEGELMKKRLELIKPIQERVFGAINKYAEANGYTMVVDVVNNQTLLYYPPALNKTEEIITLLNQ